jgi:folate-dependent phosphoribosylglycinamide formyltransferase PurN
MVISSRSTISGVKRMRDAGLTVKILRKKDFSDITEFSTAICQTMKDAHIDLIVQGGWLCLWQIPTNLQNRVMNIHPSLLPGFGGQGMWGHNVHRAVLKRGCKVSGCTVHFCTNDYDAGPIIIQKTCVVNPNDDPNSLAERVFQQECLAYPEAIKLFAQNKLSVQDNIVKIAP